MTVAPAAADVAAALRAATSVAVTCHVDPDGDAVGSLLGLLHGLAAAGVPAVGAMPDRSELPPALAFLPRPATLVPPTALPDAVDVLVVLDASSPDRVGDLRGLLDAAGTVVVVDHHRSNDFSALVRPPLILLDDTAPATTALVVEVLDALDVGLPDEAAACLYTGLVTDTGSFRFSSTTVDTHRLAARLLGHGVRPDAVAEAVYATLPYAAVRLTGRILARAVLEPDLTAGTPASADTGPVGLVWSSATLDDLAAADVAPDQLHGVIDALRGTAEAEVALFLREEATPNGAPRWLVSMRSRGRVDVSAVAKRYGGGGHVRAAGFTSTETLVKTVASVRRAIREQLR